MNIFMFAVLALLVALEAAVIPSVYSGDSNDAANSAEMTHSHGYNQGHGGGSPPKGGHAQRPFGLKHPGHDGMPRGTHGGFIPGTYGGYGPIPYGYGYPMGVGYGPLEYGAHGHAHGHGAFGGYGGMPVPHHGYFGV